MLTITEFQKKAAAVRADYEGHRATFTEAASQLSCAIDEVIQPYVIESPPEDILEEIVRAHAALRIDAFVNEEISANGVYYEVLGIAEDLIRDPDRRARLMDELCPDMQPPHTPSPEF